ncbi:ester cyclase [Kribbella sp. NPDC051620]|uniref:ester cyclase n=1 Tax=Kribbella sp. NPDC051620 TaxID=3364120 RepID=UPI0037966E66
MDLKAFYRSYLQACNERRFDDLAEFVADDVEVNGEPRGVAQYGADLRDFTEAVPDFHWELRHLLVDGNWLSAHLWDTGTSPAGRAGMIQEFSDFAVERTIPASSRSMSVIINALAGDVLMLAFLTWTRLHGIISLEIGGHLAATGIGAAALFEAELETIRTQAAQLPPAIGS